jgi:protoheme IX farnesyltransferase
MSLKSIVALFKVRLSLTVVISSLLCYLIAVVHKEIPFDSIEFISLFIGGCLITFSSNAFNQILEKEQDAIMKRTQTRPLVTGKLTMVQAFIVAVSAGLLGFVILYFGTKPIAGVLSLLSLILYAFVYTPSKAKTSFCVFIGAIPGALPPLIGYLAATGDFDSLAIYLFIFQFIWQFPHFWAIAWMLHEDYESVGYKMLPSKSGKSKITAMIILVYTVISVIIGILPYSAGLMGIFGLIVVSLLGIYFIYQSYLLVRTLQNAKKLMLASLLFMPMVYLMILLSI